MYVPCHANLNPVLLSFNRVFESFHKDIIRLQRDIQYLSEGFASPLFQNVDFTSADDYIKTRQL